MPNCKTSKDAICLLVAATRKSKFAVLEPCGDKIVLARGAVFTESSEVEIFQLG